MSWRGVALAAGLFVLGLVWGCRNGPVSDGDGDVDTDVDADTDSDADGNPWPDGDLPPDEAAARALCARYVECAGLVTPAGLGPILETYGPTGSCWDSGGDIVGVCAAACHEGLADLALAYPDEPACDECVSESHCLDAAEPFCAGGRCVECRTDDDCGTDAPTCDSGEGQCISGACANAADTEAIEMADLPSVVMICSMSCDLDPSETACMSACAQSEIGVSEPCAACAGELGGCVIGSCMTPCMEGLEAPGCQACLEASCIPGFEGCSGLEDPLSL